MNSEDLQKIETSLGVTLPQSYKEVVCPFLWTAHQGTTNASLWDDSAAIIEQSLAQRKGFGGAPAWPNVYVVIGDEDDACPYALDCSTGRVIYTDHGRLSEAPLSEYNDLSQLIAEVGATWQKPRQLPWWKFW